MAPYTPLALVGDNLGQRHRHLNLLVREAKESGILFQEFETLPEQSPIDRFFKIDLAIKHRNEDYIIRNLKDDDMLYVSRALKSKWLLDHRDIINPKYLQDVLFPEMVTPAVSKMKHWLYINLRDAAACQEFYQYYKEHAFDFAVKFLSHCSREFIIGEVPSILTKLSPHYLKVLTETCPIVAKIYFDSLATDDDLIEQYLKREQSYYNSVKCVLKTDPEVFFNITEKYFNFNCFSRLSPLATDYILRHHKSRFQTKVELYVAYLLHIPTLSNRLSVEECQEVVVKLARANYLQHWFQYKVVEPLIKRISPDKRAAFKKLVFVEKDVGKRIEEWPYDTPKSPPHSDSGPQIFDDQAVMPICWVPDGSGKRLVKKKKGSRYMDCEIVSEMKSELDRLFDEFRFVGFDRALHDLSQRLGAAGSAERRRDIFLVLVSKTGGRNDAVSALLRLAARHTNEPAHTRAAVLRSLVKRANVWRLPADTWQNLLNFGHGLGLDGLISEVKCREGFHSVVIRQLLAGECEQAVRDTFLSEFSTLAEYSLTVEEKTRVADGLQNMLEVAATDAEPEKAAEHLSQLLDILRLYHVAVNPASTTVTAIMNLALRDAEVARPLLERLYSWGIARRELLRVNLEFRRDQAALLNALRHDPPALTPKQVAEIFAADKSRFDGFISKLVVYFNQNEDITTQVRIVLKEKIFQERNIKLARPLAGLAGSGLMEEIGQLEAAGTEFVKFAAALRANAHRARPIIDLTAWGWRKAGVKAIATHAMCCREIERVALTRALATERRTVRVALALSMRCQGDLLVEIFTAAAMLHPVVAMRGAMSYFRRYGTNADLRVWDIIKPLFSNVDLATRVRLRRFLEKIECIPPAIKPDYCATFFLVIDKINYPRSVFVLSDLSVLLHEVSNDSIENILLWQLQKADTIKPPIPCPGVFIRYLMLSTNEEDFERRFTKIGNRFLEQLDSQRYVNDTHFQQRVDQAIECLKYNAAFLDAKYKSCLTVIERILAWMQKFMSKEEYFVKYVQIHLTMLFFKAIRQCKLQMPEMFADPKRRMSEGVDAVGFTFGRYIMKEVAELVCIYFDSIIELYATELVNYLDAYFMRGVSRAKFIGSLLKGLLAEGVGIQRRLAVYVYSGLIHDMEDITRKEIKKQMKMDNTISFFVHAVI